jgi:hypothetical protein
MRKLTTGSRKAALPFSVIAIGAPLLADNTNIQTAGPRGPALLQDIWLIEKLAHFDREVIPERRMHAKGWGAHGTFTVTGDIARYTRAKIFSEVGKKTPMFARSSTVAGERGAADAERDIRGTALKFYTEDGNWDIVGNNTPVFFFRDPLRFPDLNQAIKRDPRTGMRSANNRRVGIDQRERPGDRAIHLHAAADRPVLVAASNFSDGTLGQLQMPVDREGKRADALVVLLVEILFRDIVVVCFQRVRSRIRFLSWHQ